MYYITGQSAVTTTHRPSSGGGNSHCTNKVDCSAYQKDVCTNDNYRKWAHENCAKFCGVCSGMNKCFFPDW